VKWPRVVRSPDSRAALLQTKACSVVCHNQDSFCRMSPAEDVQNDERKDRGKLCSCVPEGTTLGNIGGSGSAVTAADLLARLLQTKLHPISLPSSTSPPPQKRPIHKSDVNRLIHVRPQRLDKATPFLIENSLPATRTTIPCLEGHLG
jgi:hypothetical protein